MHVVIANPRSRGQRSRPSRRMRNPQFYVSGKRPIVWGHLATISYLSWYLNSSRPNDIYMSRLAKLSSIQTKDCYAILWTNGGILSIGPLTTSFSETRIKIRFPLTNRPLHNGGHFVSAPKVLTISHFNCGVVSLSDTKNSIFPEYACTINLNEMYRLGKWVDVKIVLLCHGNIQSITIHLICTNFI